MSENNYNLSVIYGLLLVIGITSGLGDILLYKWAKLQSACWLVAAYGVWLVSITLLGFFLRIEHFTFGAAIVIATIVHLAVGLGWSFFCDGTRLSRMEMLGLLLAIIAVVLLEVGRTQPPTAEK